MHAAITKIPRLLYEEILLKTRKWWMSLFTIHDLCTVNMMGMGENPRNKRNQGKTPPFGYPPIPPSLKLEADCFPGRKNRKQAGATLGGAGILIYRAKRNKGLGAVCVDTSRWYDFYTYECSRSSVNVDRDTGWGRKIIGLGKILRTND